MYTDSNALMSTNRLRKENVKHFEIRFKAQYSWPSTHGVDIPPELLLALMISYNAEVEENKRIPFLTASIR